MTNIVLNLNTSDRQCEYLLMVKRTGAPLVSSYYPCIDHTKYVTTLLIGDYYMQKHSLNMIQFISNWSH